MEGLELGLSNKIQEIQDFLVEEIVQWDCKLNTWRAGKDSLEEKGSKVDMLNNIFRTYLIKKGI